MENWRWTDGRSVDEIANYVEYALRVLQRAGLDCEGITTPGGFGNRALPELAQATLESVKSVFNAEIPHYFRHLFTDEQSVAPRVEYVSGLDTPNPRCVVSMIGCTGDWFGGWDGLEKGKPDQCITRDGKGGRLPEVIKRGEPAIIVCHWPGIYFNGQEYGFGVFKEVVRRLEQHYPTLLWMKLSDIARYWAAKELTKITPRQNGVQFEAPFGCPGFTIKLPWRDAREVHLQSGTSTRLLRQYKALEPGTWRKVGDNVEVCFDLVKGSSALLM
jgi:hypothetical protein